MPDDAWLAALAPLYSEFPLDCEPDWQVTVSHDPELEPAPQRRIEHDGPLTRFQTDSYAGWIDLAQAQALSARCQPGAAPAALESVVAYACMQGCPGHARACSCTPLASTGRAAAWWSAATPAPARPPWPAWRRATASCSTTRW